MNVTQNSRPNGFMEKHCVYIRGLSAFLYIVGLGIGKGLTIRYISRYMGHDTIYHDTIQYNTYCDILQIFFFLNQKCHKKERNRAEYTTFYVPPGVFWYVYHIILITQQTKN